MSSAAAIQVNRRKRSLSLIAAMALALFGAAALCWIFSSQQPLMQPSPVAPAPIASGFGASSDADTQAAQRAQYNEYIQSAQARIDKKDYAGAEKDLLAAQKIMATVEVAMLLRTVRELQAANSGANASNANATSDKDTAAVIDFNIDESASKSQVTGRAVAALLEPELRNYCQLVDRSHVQRSLEELKLTTTDLADPAKAQRFGKLVGAQFLISGDVVKLGSQLTVTAKVIQVETGAIVRFAKVNAASNDELSALLPHLGRMLTLNDADRERYYAETIEYPRCLAYGQTALQQGKAAEAVSLFERAYACKNTPEAKELLAQAKAAAGSGGAAQSQAQAEPQVAQAESEVKTQALPVSASVNAQTPQQVTVQKQGQAPVVVSMGQIRVAIEEDNDIDGLKVASSILGAIAGASDRDRGPDPRGPGRRPGPGPDPRAPHGGDSGTRISINIGVGEDPAFYDVYLDGKFATRVMSAPFMVSPVIPGDHSLLIKKSTRDGEKARNAFLITVPPGGTVDLPLSGKLKPARVDKRDAENGMRALINGRKLAMQRAYPNADAEYAKAAEIGRRVADADLYSQAQAGRAWQFATAIDDRFRNGQAALQLASEAVVLGRGAESRALYLALEALAAAQAETGHLQEAVNFQNEALGDALQRGIAPQDLENIKARLAIYSSGRAVRY